MEMQILKITPPPDVQIILGQSHFIKTVEDVSECLVSCVPNIKFGIGFGVDPYFWERFLHYLIDTPNQYLSPLFALLLLLSPFDVLASILK